MTLTVAQCIADMKLAGGTSDGFVPTDAVNNVGRIIAGLHAWKWRERLGRLNTRASVDIVNATWTESSKTLTKTGAFADYVFLAGDEVEITGGADAELGFYPVASRVDANSITLETSIGAAADTDTDIDGTLHASACALPADCEALIDRPRAHKLSTSGAFVELVTRDELISYRYSSSTDTSGSPAMGAIVYAQTAAAGAPVKRLELHPAPSSNTTSAYVVPYRAMWKTVNSDQDTVPIPDFLEPFFRDACRLYARSIIENDSIGFAERLASRLQSPDYAAVLYCDGLVQPGYGRLGAQHTPPEEWTILDPV